MSHFIASRVCGTAAALLALWVFTGCEAPDPGEDEPPPDPGDPCVPDVEGLIAEWELSADVEVLVDDQGVPHIYAQNDLDLFYASGYLIATDRLFQMDMIRRASVGTLAEVLGEEAVESDIQARTFDFDRFTCEIVAEHAEEGVDELNAAAAYLSGINDRVEQVLAGEAPLPDGYAELEFEPTPFTRWDTVAMGMRLNFAFSNSLFFDLFYTVYDELSPVAGDTTVPVFAPATDRFIMVEEAPDTPPSGPPPGAAVLHPDATEADLLALLDWGQRFQRNWGWNRGSNNWAVSGEHTDNGRPLIAGDPHSFLADPSYLTLQHLNSEEAGGQYDVAGFSFAGTAGVHMGHNRDLVWTATTNFADAVDLWDVEVDGDEVRIGDEWHPIDEQHETIRVRQSDGSFFEQILVHEVVGEYGVLLSDEMLPLPTALFANGRLLMNWTGFTPTSGLLLYLRTDRAADLDDFAAAIDFQKSGIQNWVGATAEGIRYKTHGRVPDRGVPPSPAAQVMDGNDASTYWDGFLSQEFMPSLDEDQPFITTANNDPWGHTADNDPFDDEFYYGAWYAPGFRAGRIHDALEAAVAEGGITAEQMIDLQWDQTSEAALRMVPVLAAVAETISTDPALAEYEERIDLTEAIAQLSTWDRVMDADSAEAALFRVWFTLLTREVLSDDLTLLFDSIEEIQVLMLEKVLVLAYEDDIESLLDGEGPLAMLRTLDEALGWVEEQEEALGVEPLTWGDIHVVSFDSDYVTYFDFEVGEASEVVMGGDGTSINVAECHFWEGSELADRCVGDFGSVYRAVASFDSDGTPVYRYNWPFGHTGEATDWAEGTYRELPFRRDDVQAAAVDSYVLEP